MPVGSKLIALLSTSFPLRPSVVFRLARYSRPTFAALSSASVFHGRIHSVFNPKLGFWSRAINQFHSEAVINEGCGEAATSFADSKNSHPWPEWSKLADMLAEKGYSDRCMASGDDDDSFLVEENMPEKFLKAAEACLGFARDRPDILRLLAKKNMEAIVLNGSPFLFKNGENSARRMKLFLSGEGSNELELERAQTIDIMRYLLSYAYDPLSSSHDSNLKSEEHVEPSVRKLLCELFNLSGTVWKPKSVDATSTELPLSNDRLSGHPGQYIETKTADWINSKIPGRSSAGSESQLNASCNFTDKEYGNSIFNQKQGPEVTLSSQTGVISTPNGRFIENSAQPSTSVLDKNVESWNRDKTSNISNAQVSNENNPVYGTTNSSEPPSHLGNNFNNYYGGYTGKPTQPSGNLWTKIGSNNSISSTESTPNSSPPPSIYQGNYSARYDGHNNASRPPGGYQGYDGHNNASQTGFTSNSSPPPGGYQGYDGLNNASQTGLTSNLSPPPNGYQGYDGHINASQTGFTSNLSPPPGGHQGYDGHRNASRTGFTSNSSPPPGGYQNYDGHRNASQTGFTSNLSPPPNGYQGYDRHRNASQTGFTSNSSPPPSSYQGYDGHSNASRIGFTSNSSLSPGGYQGYDGYNNASQTGFTSNSSPPPNGYQGYDGHRNASQTGVTSNLSPPLGGYQGYDGHNNASQTGLTSTSSPPPCGYQGYEHNNASQTGFTSNSSQPPSNSWNTYNTSPGGFNEQLKQPSSNSYGAASTVYSPQTPNNSWNKYDTPYGENVMKSTQPSSNSWNTSNTSFGWTSTNSSHPPGNSWNNQNSADSYHRNPPNSNQTLNGGVNGNYGYSGKSLEGSCVKEPDPLDMSEEAKAERWFHRAAQIKDISELSQIPDEDFPQIMPLRKGVNRFVVSKRKTPLERRLASQQYKRSLPVVSSEPEKDPTVGEKEN